MSSGRRIVCGLLLAGSVWNLAGCRSIPATRYYVLEPPAIGGAPGQGLQSGLAIGVQEFVVDPPYDQDQLVYRTGEDSSEVGFYAYHRWAAPLGRLLPVAVARALTEIPGIASIQPMTPNGEYDAILTGRLFHLDEVDEPQGQRVRIRLELELSGADGTALWSQIVAAENNGRAAEVPEVVERMTAALGRALEQARDGLAAALGHQPTLSQE